MSEAEILSVACEVLDWVSLGVFSGAGWVSFFLGLFHFTGCHVSLGLRNGKYAQSLI